MALLWGMTDIKRSREQLDKRRPYGLRRQSMRSRLHEQICIIKQWFFEQALPKSGQQINRRYTIVRPTVSTMFEAVRNQRGWDLHRARQKTLA